MRRNNIYLAILLTFMWVVLSENISYFSLLTGVLISTACIWFSNKHIPSNKSIPINFFKLPFYGLYLIGQVYLSGFNVIKLILTDAKVELVETRTNLKDKSLRALLAASVTLTPGSSVIAVKGNKISFVWLRGIHDVVDDPGERIKGKLEKRIFKMRKQQTQKRV